MLVLTHTLLRLTLLAPLLLLGMSHAGEALSVEILTASGRPVTGADHERLRTAIVTIYAVDALEHFESTLSEGLPIDPESAKIEALRRMEELDKTRIAPAKAAAVGLAKAIQYGVDRYPAIVFEERAIVYGVTDLIDAIERYDAWQRDKER